MRKYTRINRIFFYFFTLLSFIGISISIILLVSILVFFISGEVVYGDEVNLIDITEENKSFSVSGEWNAFNIKNAYPGQILNVPNALKINNKTNSEFEVEFKLFSENNDTLDWSKYIFVSILKNNELPSKQLKQTGYASHKFKLSPNRSQIAGYRIELNGDLMTNQLQEIKKSIYWTVYVKEVQKNEIIKPSEEQDKTSILLPNLGFVGKNLFLNILGLFILLLAILAKRYGVYFQE